MDKLKQAVAYIKSGDIEKGRQLLVEIIKQNPRDENAWLWMSKCVKTSEQRRDCFERVLKINPQNPHAIKGLSRIKQSRSGNSKSYISKSTNNGISSKQSVEPIRPSAKAKSSSRNIRKIFLIILISFLGVISVCCVGIAIISMGDQSPGVTEEENKNLITATYLKRAMEGRGYNFENDVVKNGLTNWIGTSPNGTSTVQIIERENIIQSTTIMIGLVQDNDRALEENVRDMNFFLATASPGWNSNAWLQKAIEEMLTTKTDSVLARHGNEVIQLTSLEPFLFLEITYE